MKKILLIIIIILLAVLSYYAFAKGITIGKLQVLSVNQLKEKNNELDAKIEQANRLIDTQYPSKISELKSAASKMEQAKKEYLDLTNVSTNDQILKATMEESYTIELLWTKIGRHAISKGVIVEMAVTSGDAGTAGLSNLNFTINGSYIAIINFVEALENDSVLNFRIKNFKLLPNDSSASILRATFTVKNVAIQGNSSSQQVQSSTTSDTTDNTTSDTTNNTTNDTTNDENDSNENS